MPMARVLGPGCPDAASDLVAASIVEEYLKRDPAARLDVRVVGGTGALFVAGLVRSTADFDVSAVVRRAASSIDPSWALEPFVSLEPAVDASLFPTGAREDAVTVGYATGETSSLFPPAVHAAREAVRELASRRENDPDWFWLHADVSVTASVQGSRVALAVNALIAEGITDDAAREAVISALARRVPGAMVTVTLTPSSVSGLGLRVGTSGRASSLLAYGTALPCPSRGVGREPSDVLNAGTWLARHAARELVASGTVRAALVELAWRRGEEVPVSIRCRDERGQDLSAALDRSQFDLRHIEETWKLPSVVTDDIRFPYVGASVPPWEC